jgi:rod shape-determining protein MreB and related proteins
VKRVGDLAIDLGTANTLVFQEGKGIVYDEPSVVAMDAREGDVLAIGEEAWEMIGRTPARIVAVRPLRRGAITDYEVTSQMIRLILRRVGVTRFGRPKALICVPSAITEVERRAVRDAASSAGARTVSLIEEPMAAAIGAGLPVHEPLGNLVVDVGGGTSEVGMVSMGGIIARRSMRIGGFDMDEVIQRHLRREYGLAIGERAAEQVKMSAGTAYPVTGVAPVEIRGREIATGMPKVVEVQPEEIREVLTEPVNAVVGAARQCLSESDPELGQDVLERGMFLTGGGALLRGLDTRLSQECEVPVHLTDHPLQTVVLGAGKCLELLAQGSGIFGGSPWLR